MKGRTMALCAALVAAWLAPAARSADSISLVLDAPGGAYSEAAGALRRELPPGTAVTQSQPGAGGASAAAPRIVVAIGPGACADTLRSGNAPLVCALLTRASFDAMAGAARGRRPVTAVVLDQPPNRQMALIRLALPKAGRVAMLLGPESAASHPAFAAAASRSGLQGGFEYVARPDALYPALQRLLAGNSHALLAAPDATIYNTATVHNILRTAIRARVPVFAYSGAYVTAGALAAVYSTPAQIGRQAGRLASEALRGRALPAPQAPDEFTVSVNRQVAGSLGIALPDEQALAAQLRRLEQGR